MSPQTSRGVPLGLDHLNRLAELLDAEPRVASEYSLANLYLYRARHSYHFVDGAVPHLAGRTYDGESHALPLCLLDAAAAGHLLNGLDCIYPLDENEAQRLAVSGGFCLDQRAEDADYLYDVSRLGALEGAKAKRAQAAAFERMDPRLADFDAAAAHAVLAEWLVDAGRGPDHADAHECAEAIACREALGLSGVSVFLGQEPVAFLLAGPPRGGERVVHFAKGRRSLAGAYPWMFSRYAGLAGTRLLNFEQDLGNAGLMQAKRALGPLAKAAKYRLRKIA